MCLNFKLGGLTSSCSHLLNPADVGVDPQQLDKLSPTNTQLCRKPQSVHVVYRLVVSSGCDVRLSSAQSCWQDYWTIMSHNKHHTGDSFTSRMFPVFSDSSEDGNICRIYTLTEKHKRGWASITTPAAGIRMHLFELWCCRIKRCKNVRQTTFSLCMWRWVHEVLQVYCSWK